MKKWKIKNLKFTNKILKKIDQLIKLKQFDKSLSEIKKISFFDLDESSINSLKKKISVNYNSYLKSNNYRKLKILFLSNHYLEYFKYNFFISGIEKNLIFDLEFGKVNHLNFNELSKNIKDNIKNFDLIIYSNFINYEKKLDIDSSFLNLSKNIELIKKFNPNILIIKNPLVSEKFIHNNLLKKYNTHLEKFCSKNKFLFWDISLLQNKIGFDNLHDSRFFFDYKIFFNPKFSEDISNHLASFLSFKFNTNIRLVITDLDNTMWSGLAAEDTIEEIEYLPGSSLGEPHYHYQLFLNELFKKNILIAAASKNKIETIKGIFKEKNFPFKFKNFINTKINWKAKSQNILEICKDTNLSPEHVLFIDDSKSEIFEVLENVPKINVLSFEKSSEINSNINSSNLFMEFSNEKINRFKSIQTSKPINFKLNDKKSYNRHLKALKMKMKINKINNNNINRFIELINKTSQFNFNLKRTNHFELKKFLKNKNNIGLTFQLSDRFIDHGIISNTMIKVNNSVATIEAFVMSCRVFERKVEFFIMDKIIKKLKKNKIKFIECLFIKTNRNSQFENYYDLMGFKNIKNTNNKKFYRLNINEYKKIDFYIK